MWTAFEVSWPSQETSREVQRCSQGWWKGKGKVAGGSGLGFPEMRETALVEDQAPESSQPRSHSVTGGNFEHVLSSWYQWSPAGPC